MTVKVFSEQASLRPAPIQADWILSGQPLARNAILAQSADRMAVTLLWDCTAGRFQWRYDQDETIRVIEGSATLWLEDGRVETLAPGVVVFFPAGAAAVWEVHGYIRKLAVFRQTAPRPVALGLRAWAKLKARIATRGARGRESRGALPAHAGYGSIGFGLAEAL